MNIIVVKGNIIEQNTDCIVNTTNAELAWEDKTVNGMIHIHGGPDITKAMKQIHDDIGDLKPGDVVYTLGYNLPCKYVIHTLGPHGLGNHEPNKNQQLKHCYCNSLTLANQLNCKSISFPSISTGTFMFPLKDAAAIAWSVISDFKKITNSSIEEIRLVCWTDEVYNVYNEYKILN